MQARHIPDTRDARSFPDTEARLAESAAPTYVAAGGHEVPEGVLAGVDEDLPDCMQAPSLHQIGAHLQGLERVSRVYGIMSLDICYPAWLGGYIQALHRQTQLVMQLQLHVTYSMTNSPPALLQDHACWHHTPEHVRCISDLTMAASGHRMAEFALQALHTVPIHELLCSRPL